MLTTRDDTRESLVRRSAVAAQSDGLMTHYDLDRFDALLRTNVRGTFLVNRQAARQLRDGGTIVNLAGSAVGLALPTDAASAASSAAVEAMTRVLACELRGRHITVNAVAPGLENPGDPAAIADIAAFLVSGDGRSLNGQVIHVDGGTEWRPGHPGVFARSVACPCTQGGGD
jgi:3-oxoacyl-[acyl-carrier protein] reductase